MFCANCGREIPDDVKFCNFCGSAVIPQKSESSPEQKEVPVQPLPTAPGTEKQGYENMEQQVQQAKKASWKDKIRHTLTIILLWAVIIVLAVLIIVLVRLILGSGILASSAVK